MYIIRGKNHQRRVLVVPVKELHRWKFYERTGKKKLPVSFTDNGTDAFAFVGKAVIVYNKPHPAQYHREYMKHNARAHWLGLPAEYDRLMDDMLEFEEEI